MKFYEVILNDFKVIEQTWCWPRNWYLQSSKGNNLKLYIQELWFLHFAGYPMLVYISMKFHEDILNSLKVIERTQFSHRNCYLQNSKGHNSKIYISKSYGSSALHVAYCWLIFVWSFLKVSWMVFKLESGHDFITATATYKVQRGIAQKYISKSYDSCDLHIV